MQISHRSSLEILLSWIQFMMFPDKKRPSVKYSIAACNFKSLYKFMYEIWRVDEWAICGFIQINNHLCCAVNTFVAAPAYCWLRSKLLYLMFIDAGFIMPIYLAVTMVSHKWSISNSKDPNDWSAYFIHQSLLKWIACHHSCLVPV